MPVKSGRKRAEAGQCWGFDGIVFVLETEKRCVSWLTEMNQAAMAPARNGISPVGLNWRSVCATLAVRWGPLAGDSKNNLTQTFKRLQYQKGIKTFTVAAKTNV